MKAKKLFYGWAGLLSSGVLASFAVGITGLIILNNAQAQVSNSEHNTHHPSTETPPQRDQHFSKDYQGKMLIQQIWGIYSQL
jgi:uncharacterized protein (DUF305 family)